MTLFILPLLATAALGSVWTVDDNGPANFSSIGAAIAAASPGDVLIVEPGTYAPFTLNKRLSILGRAGLQPQITGQVDIVGAPTFSLVGFSMPSLAVSNVPNHGRIDDCTIGWPLPTNASAALRIFNCSQIEVERSLLFAGGGTYDSNDGTGARISNSNVVIIDAQILGGDGLHVVESSGTNGGDAVKVDTNSDVTLVNSSAIGGKSGVGGCLFGNCPDGPAGDGVDIKNSTLRLRGAGNTVAGGVFYPIVGGLPGFAIRADHSQLVVSGVTLETHCLVGCTTPTIESVASTVVTPPVFEPWLEIIGFDTAFATKSIVLHAPGGSALLLGSLKANFLSASGLGVPLWLTLPAPIVLPITIPSPQTSVALALTLPSPFGLEGVYLEMQAIFPNLPDALKPSTTFVTNPAGFVIRR